MSTRIPARAPASLVPHATARSASTGKRSWEDFQARFGPDLEAEYGMDGRISSVHGTLSAATSGAKLSQSEERAIARAKEVIDALAPELGLRDGFPLDHAVAHTGENSAQVFFRETGPGGAAVEPGGIVTVDLGPEGQVLGIFSSYVSDLNVTNEPRITPDQARAQAGSGRSVQGGAPIVWVARGSHEAKHAYEFGVDGRQVIVDADTGSILSRRDKRVH